MKKALVMVYTGTLNKSAKQSAIERCNSALKKIFSNIDFYYIFSSNMINTILEKKGEKSYRIEKIVKELEKYDEVIFQPTYLTNGKEMENFKNRLKELKIKVPYKMGEILLKENEDFENISKILIGEIGEKVEGEEVILIGHGLEERIGSEYIELEKILNKKGDNYKIGLLKGIPNIEKIILELNNKILKRVRIYPLMFVAGNHLQNDIEKDIKLKLEKQGVEVDIKKKGIGEYELIVSFIKNKIERVL